VWILEAQSPKPCISENPDPVRELPIYEFLAIKSTDNLCWNHQIAACNDVIRIICIRGLSRSAYNRWDQSAGGFARSAPDIPQAHVGGGAILQLPTYHAQAIRHIRHLLTTELSQTLVCSLILSRIDYCNAVLHGAPSYSTKKPQRVQNNTARIVLSAQDDPTPARSAEDHIYHIISYHITSVILCLSLG